MWFILYLFIYIFVFIFFIYFIIRTFFVCCFLCRHRVVVVIVTAVTVRCLGWGLGNLPSSGQNWPIFSSDERHEIPKSTYGMGKFLAIVFSLYNQT